MRTLYGQDEKAVMTASEILNVKIESLHRKELIFIREKLQETPFLFLSKYEVLHQWGKIELRLNMPHAAEGYFKKALLLHKEHVESMRELAVLYTKSERLKEALKLFATIVTIKPDDWEAWYKGGIILQNMNETTKALAWLTMAKKYKV